MKYGPLFAIRTDKRQLRVGKPKQPVAVLEILEPGPLQGQELILTERDLAFINFGIAHAKGDEALGRYMRWEREEMEARRFRRS